MGSWVVIYTEDLNPYRFVTKRFHHARTAKAFLKALHVGVVGCVVGYLERDMPGWRYAKAWEIISTAPTPDK